MLEHGEVGERVGVVDDEVRRVALVEAAGPAEPLARAPRGRAAARPPATARLRQLGDLGADQAVRQHAARRRCRRRSATPASYAARDGLVAPLVQRAHMVGVRREPRLAARGVVREAARC